MKVRTLWCVCLCYLVASCAFADLTERRLFWGGSARILGLGGAGIAGPEDGTSLFWNPALLAVADQTEVGFTDAPLQSLAPDREGFLSILLHVPVRTSPFDRSSVGIASWFDGWGEDPQKNRIIRTGLGVSLGGGFALGANLVHERRNTDLGVDVGWDMDLGIVWQRYLASGGHQIRAGMSAQRLTGKREWVNIPEALTPMQIGLGVGYQPDPASWIVADLVYTNDDTLSSTDRLRVRLGIERWFAERFALRIGYSGIAHYDRITDGEWSRGVGFRAGDAEIDYAYMSGGQLAHGIHWISASLKWEWPGGTQAPEMIEEPMLPIEPEAPAEVTTVDVSFQATPRVFSPNGDGRQDVVSFRVDISPTRPWLIRIQDMEGQLVRSLSALRPHWNGLDTSMRPMKESRYRAVLVSTADDQELASDTVMIDVTPPGVTMTTEPLVLMSQESQPSVVIEVPKVHVQAQDANALHHWALNISNSSGETLANFSGDAAPPATILWKDAEKNWPSGNPPQSFQCTLQVEDVAGNMTVEKAEMALVDLAQIGSRREKRGIVMTLPGVAFDTNSAEIRPEFANALQEAAQAIRAYPNAKVRIEGHTDDRGTEGYNMNLSLARANAVMDYLVANLELDPLRFSTVGYGESQPIADNATEQGRQKNRRVEIVLLLGEDEGPAKPAKVQTHPPTDVPAVEKAPPTNAEPPQQTQTKPRFTVSVGSFRNRENAEALLEVVQQFGLEYEIRLLKIPMGNSDLYRVAIGAFETEKPAEELAVQLEKEHGLLPVVMPYE